MPIIVKMAKSSFEINSVLNLRYRLLKSNNSPLASSHEKTEKFSDHLDIYPSTINIVAFENSVAVGTLRSVEFDGEENILNWLFDFRETALALKKKCYILDSWCISAKSSKESTLARELLKMAFLQLNKTGARYALSVIPETWLEEIKTFDVTVLAQNLEYAKIKMVAVSFDLESIHRRFLEKIVDKEIQRFAEVFYVTLFHPGEPIVVQGERGQTAYLSDEGEIEVVIKAGENLMPLSTIPVGHLIGEIAMLTSEPRTASLIAKSETSCFTFDRTEFIRLMYEEPHRNLDLFKIFSKRISSTNKKLSELQGRS